MLQLTTESYRILGLEDGTPLRNIDFFNAVHPEDRNQLAEAIMRTRTESSRHEVELRLVRQGDDERRVLLTAVPFSGDGTRTTITGTIQDLTDRGRSPHDREAELQIAVERDLRRALEDDLLFLEFQPIISLERGYIGAEALVRWQHPTRGVLKPRDFIPLAEETGLIVPLGAFVISSACRELRRWLDAGVGGDFTMAVNVSPSQLRSRGFPAALARAMDEAGVSASSVPIEITESMLVEGAIDEGVLQEIWELGVRIAIDDFGTKYSSLNYLTRLPINALKVDESFVRAIDDVAGRAIVVAITALGKALGLDVTAEGVETEAQLQAIREVGCNTGLLDLAAAQLRRLPCAPPVEPTITRSLIMTRTARGRRGQ